MNKNIAKTKAMVDHGDCGECLHDYMFLMKVNSHSEDWNNH